MGVCGGSASAFGGLVTLSAVGTVEEINFLDDTFSGATVLLKTFLSAEGGLGVDIKNGGLGIFAGATVDLIKEAIDTGAWVIGCCVKVRDLMGCRRDTRLGASELLKGALVFLSGTLVEIIIGFSVRVGVLVECMKGPLVVVTGTVVVTFVGTVVGFGRLVDPGLDGGGGAGLVPDGDSSSGLSWWSLSTGTTMPFVLRPIIVFLFAIVIV